MQETGQGCHPPGAAGHYQAASVVFKNPSAGNRGLPVPMERAVWKAGRDSAQQQPDLARILGQL